MTRWMAWFLVGFALVASLAVLGNARNPDLDAIGGVFVVGLWGWTIVTLYAVPIGVIRWLLRGRRRAS